MKWLFLLLPLILLAIPVRAAATNYTSAYVIADNYIVNGTNENNTFGTQTVGVISSSASYFGRTMFMLNLSMIPENSTVRSAYLFLYMAGSQPSQNLSVYNTSRAWNATNLTWFRGSGWAGTLQGYYYFNKNVSYNKINITNAVITAYAQGIKNVSILLQKTNESDYSANAWNFNTKDAAANRPIIEINSTLNSCISDCGSCGCNNDSTACYVPPIVGSWCSDAAGDNRIITTTTSDCISTDLTCPNTTVCNQVSPLANMTLFPTTPGEANLPYCHQCYFVNIKVATAPLASTYTWVTVLTNCPNNPECNCLGWLCSNNLYEAPNITSVPYNITQWVAGCFNPSTGYWINVTNSTGQQTTIDDLVNQSCGSNCNLTNNTPQTQCPINTTTNCYDSACNRVQCTGTPGTSLCSSNTGGQLALSIGSLMGITDCGLAQNILAILTSIIIGFAIMFYTKESEHSGQAFIFGTISMLVMFTLIGWFASWLMVLLIVIGAYLVAKSMGVGGG